MATRLPAAVLMHLATAVRGAWLVSSAQPRHRIAQLAACHARDRRGLCTMASPPAAPTDADESPDVLFARRREKAERMREAGGEPYAYSYAPTHSAAALAAEYAELEDGAEDESAVVAVSGRLLTKRVFGKLAFFTVQDATGTVQLYLEKKRLGGAFKEFLESTDGGDIVGAKGAPKRTNKGELSVAASEVTLLTKALRPLPDKWQGLTDTNKRYRQRYLDMISNPAVRATFAQRAKITSYLRSQLDGTGFLEIETPSLHGVAGGADARPFETFHNALGLDLNLRIATELHLKRLIVGGCATPAWPYPHRPMALPD